MEAVNDKTYLDTLKKSIEDKSGWGDSSQWSTKDFENLSEFVLEATQVNISVTTLKRLLGKVQYSAQPRVSTLDAITQYLGYNNWREFKKAIDNVRQEATEETDKKKKEGAGTTPFTKMPRKFSVKQVTWLVGVLGVVGLLVMFVANSQLITKKKNYAGKGSFHIKKVSKGLPNTVVFDYDISKISSDNIQIQQYWDKTKRIDINKANNEATCMYYYPGYYRAKLVVDDQIIQEKDLFISSDGWLAAIQGKPSPRYILTNELLKNGQLKLSDKIQQEIDNKENAPILNYFYLKDLKTLPGSDFIMQTGFRHTQKSGANICQRMGVVIVGIHGVLSLPFAIPGCVGKLGAYLNGQAYDGKDNDLSGFGCDFSKMQHLKVINQQNNLKVYLNDQLVWTKKVKKDIGRIAGIRYQFRGYGEVDYVKYAHLNEKVVFQEDF